MSTTKRGARQRSRKQPVVLEQPSLFAVAVATPSTPAAAASTAPASPTRVTAAFDPSVYQEAIFAFIRTGSGDGLVNAVAGSGKTKTLVEAAKLLAEEDALFVAFNKHIAEELAGRLRGTSMIARTIHSIGNAVLANHLGGGRITLDGRKYAKLAREEVWRSIVREPGADQREAIDTLTRLANFARLCLVDASNREALGDLVDHFGIPLDERYAADLLDAVPHILKVGERQAEQSKIIDFTDMIYLPIRWNLEMPRYGWVFTDECQDLNACQLELVLRCRAEGGRMIFVGDRYQAIYGFSGADARSFDTIAARTNATLLPLSICYRCPSSHLELARAIVPQIEARPNAPAGTIANVSDATLPEVIRAGDMVLCRLTAPLVSLCIHLIQRRIPARVRGRDIGKQLTDIIKSVQEWQVYHWDDFGHFLDEYERKQIAKLEQREGTESQVESVRDRVEAVRTCYEAFQAENAASLSAQLEDLFDDGRPSVLLSTVHRAKGLENDRIFLLKPEKMPLVWPKQQSWQFTQEMNLKYVALTRAKSELYFISASGQENDSEDDTNA